MLTVFVVCLLSYFLGSFPSSIVASKIFKGIDIRNFGSGNAGGTNSFRVLGWKLGLLVTLADIGKGAVATLLISKFQLEAAPLPSLLTPFHLQMLAGLSAIIGHIWTVFASFKGGKGVATAAGMFVSLFPWAFLTMLVLFLLIASTTRYVSLASVAALGLFPVILIFYRRLGWEEVPTEFIWLSFFLSLLVAFTHRENIKRLIEGKEKKFYGYDPQSAAEKPSPTQKMG